MGAVSRHAYLLQSHIHPFFDFLRRNAQVLRTEGHIFLHNGSHQLVVRILKYHAHLLADIPDMGKIGGLHTLHIDFPIRGNKQGVQMTGQRGLAAAISTDDGRKGPLPDSGGYIGEGIKLLSLFRLKGMGQMTDIKKNVSTLFSSFILSFSMFPLSYVLRNIKIQ